MFFRRFFLGLALAGISLSVQADTSAFTITDDSTLDSLIAQARADYFARVNATAIANGFNRLNVTVLVPDGNGGWLRGSYNPEEIQYPASCVKLAYMAAAMYWEKLNDKPVDYLDAYVRPMITVSDNVATGEVVDAITGAPNNTSITSTSHPDWPLWYAKRQFTENFLNARGLFGNQTIIHKTYPTNSGSSPSGAEQVCMNYRGGNRMQAKLSASLMLEVVKGAIEADTLPGATAYMRSLLTHPRFDPNGDSCLGFGLPPGAVYENKIGIAYDTVEDIAYIKMPNGKECIMVVFSNGYVAPFTSDPLPWDGSQLGPFAELLVEYLGLNAGDPPKWKIDNADGGTTFTTVGSWTVGTAQQDKWGSSYHYATCASTPTALAIWNLSVPQTGKYEVCIWYPAGSNRATDAKFGVTSDGGTTTFTVNQQKVSGRWYRLGDFFFSAGTGRVTLSNQGSDTTKLVVADAVKITKWPDPQTNGNLRWKLAGILPPGHDGLHNAAACVGTAPNGKRYVYLLGGSIGGLAGSNVSNKIFMATINADGSVGPFTQLSTTLPGVRAGLGAGAAGNRIYAWGGYDSSYAVQQNVWYWSVNTDGTLGSVTSGTSLPTEGSGQSAAKVGDGFGRMNMAFLPTGSTTPYLYVIGGEGRTNSGSYPNLKYAYISAINPSTGANGAWSPSSMQNPVTNGSTNIGIWNNATAFVRGSGSVDYVYTIGGNLQPNNGQFSSSNITDKVSCASINRSTGQISSWNLVTSLPVKKQCAAAVTVDNRIYVLGGPNETTIYDRSVYVGTVDTATGNVTWSTEADSLPESFLPNCPAAVSYTMADGSAYVLVASGNATGNVDIYYAKVKGYDLSVSMLDFGATDPGSPTPPQSYTISGIGLSSNVTITAPAGFELALNSSGPYSTTLTLTPTDGLISETTLYVRFAPTAKGAASGYIIHSGGGVANQSIAVSGTGLPVTMSLFRA